MAWTKRYVRADANGSGNGTTNTNTGVNGAWTLAQALAGAAAGMKLIVLGGFGTFANTTTSRTASVSGTTTAPIWWAGCNTAEDDLSLDFVTARPVISFTTGHFSVSGNFNIFSCIDFTGAPTTSGPTGGVVNVGAVESLWLDRCRIANTAASAGGTALGSNASHRGAYTRCRFEATSTAAAVCDVSGENSGPCNVFSGCAFAGGGDGIRIAATSADTHFVLHKCSFRTGANGIADAGTAGSTYVLDCSFRPGTDGVNLSATRAVGGHVLFADCAFGNCGGYGIDNSTGVNTGFVHRYGNLFGANTSGSENGMGDAPSLSESSDGATSPFTSSTDLTLASGSAGRATADAGAWPGEAFSGYRDKGTVQHQDAGGSSGPVGQIVGARSIGTY